MKETRELEDCERMDDSRAILCQISSLKVMLDKANEEIEDNIQTTREIESEIVKCSEIENGLGMKESELTKMICIAEFEMNELIQVAVIARTSVEFLEKELSCLRMNRDEVLKRIDDRRERFIRLCRNFQRDIVKGENEELWTLLSEKKVLENERHILNRNNNALRNSMSAFVEEILEELHSSNSALHVDIQSGNLENEKLLEDIDDLKISILSTSSFDNNHGTAHPHTSSGGFRTF
ncbi:hypothetical protein HHK36_024315 [Tetracentron sinense]|uniref:Uncharacterized protein n=1 Tax=Tetracentron sinense TaxID=13715 RepID=A0A834YQE2_TETSI|nr:hypothetical protein HHK36_024315 [Tetracentron sinense]